MSRHTPGAWPGRVPPAGGRRAGRRVVVAGEAKWTREPVGFARLNHTRRVAGHIPGVDPDTEVVLFGRAFDSRLVAAASQERVWLVTPDALYG